LTWAKLSRQSSRLSFAFARKAKSAENLGRPIRSLTGTRVKRFFLVAFAFSLLPVPSSAASRFVTDEFEIALRASKDSSQKMIRSLPSGTKVELVSSDKKEGFSLVRTADGVEGWVLTRHLIDKPIAKERLILAEKRVKTLDNTIIELQKQLAAFQLNPASVNEVDLATLIKEKSEMETELARIREFGGDPKAIMEENEKLKTQILTLKRESQTLQQENAALASNSERDWFMVGAGVFVIGTLLGIALPNFRRRKKDSWT